MKKILYSLVTLFALLSMTACVNDFITEAKPDTTNEQLVFSRADYIESNLLGCYHYFKSTSTMNYSFMGGKTYAALDSRGDDIINVSNPQTLQDTYEMTVKGDALENDVTWSMAYVIINECNVFIDNMASYKPTEILGQATYDQYIAEAKFVRAFTYYVLCQLYAVPYSVNPEAPAVCLRLKGLKSSGNNNCPLSTISAVYAQILEDLSDANIAALPAKSAANYSAVRASADAANMLKMRVLMAENKWSDAAAAGEKVKGYTLVSDPASLFGYFDEKSYTSTEMIFVLPMNSQDMPNTQSKVSDYNSKTSAVTWLDTESGILSQADYSLAQDLRIANLTEEDGGHLFSKKFLGASGAPDWIPQMRYAETLLNLAECYANIADQSSLVKARAALKAVRSRSVPAASETLDIDAMNAAALKTAVYNERRAEFVCEGMRSIDIMRRGENFVKKNQFIDITVTPSEASYVWPIPANELSYNKDIK